MLSQIENYSKKMVVYPHCLFNARGRIRSGTPPLCRGREEWKERGRWEKERERERKAVYGETYRGGRSR